MGKASLREGLINKEEYQNSKSEYIYSIGQSFDNGNRKFVLDIENNIIIFKPKQGTKIVLDLPKLRPNVRKQLLALDKVSKLKQLPITYKLNQNYVYIAFDDIKLNELDKNNCLSQNTVSDLLSNRILGIDLNPNNIGISILEYKNSTDFKVIKTINYSLYSLTNKKGNHNKLKYETIEISKKIVNLCLHYRVGSIALEDLNIRSKDNEKGKNNNSLLNNKWLRNLFQNQIKKRAEKAEVKTYNVLAYYTSYIGNMQYNYVDAVNASIEIARRTYQTQILKNKAEFYPALQIKTELRDQWKESINLDVMNWKELCNEVKNSKMRYRVSLEECKRTYNVWRMSSIKSGIILYDFV